MAEGSHGGARKGAGRKSKAQEEKVRALAIAGLISVFGSEEQAFEAIAEEAQKGSYQHLKALLEYGYGKPKESLDIDMPEGIQVILKKHGS